VDTPDNFPGGRNAGKPARETIVLLMKPLPHQNGLKIIFIPRYFFSPDLQPQFPPFQNISGASA
jgi:hypothetical protein